jgi:hypothetical protein
MNLVQPIDGAAAYLEDDRGRRLYFPNPKDRTPDYAGQVSAGTAVDAVAATATATYGASAVTAAKKIVFGGITYTFRAAVAANYDVKIEALVDDTATNLVNAINLNQAPGVGDNAASGKYMAPAANPVASAAVTVGSNLVTLTALVKGVAGDALTLTTDETEITLSGATFGAGAGVNGVDGLAGVAGEVRFDTSYLYLCLSDVAISSTGGWKKIALSSL